MKQKSLLVDVTYNERRTKFCEYGLGFLYFSLAFYSVPRIIKPENNKDVNNEKKAVLSTKNRYVRREIWTSL